MKDLLLGETEAQNINVCFKQFILMNVTADVPLHPMSREMCSVVILTATIINPY